MWSCEAKLRYFYWDGQVHIDKGKTGGQQGDPLEMLIFNLTVQHIWGRVLPKFQGTREYFQATLRTPSLISHRNCLNLMETFPLTLSALTALWASLRTSRS
jgi:hypothetical protein